MTKEELLEYFIEEMEYTEDDFNEMTKYEKLDEYLACNGIIGYTTDILEIIDCIFETNLSLEDE